jgi:hypothetical protein
MRKTTLLASCLAALLPALSFAAANDQDHDDTNLSSQAFVKRASSAPKVDKDLQAFASKMLPKLEQHHQLVAQVESKMPSMTASKKSSSTNR